MSDRIILASGSEIRCALLAKAGVKFDVSPARIDEEAIIASLVAEGAKPRDVADKLAEAKARKVSQKTENAWVIGCDQVLDFQGTILQKPTDLQDARSQLELLSGEQHSLMSAAVIYQDAKPVWRHIGVVRLRMRTLSRGYIDSYLERNWQSVQHSVGSYKLEEEGVRLFSRVEGDYFNVLGLPLIELLGYLTLRGVLEG